LWLKVRLMCVRLCNLSMRTNRVMNGRKVGCHKIPVRGRMKGKF